MCRGKGEMKLFGVSLNILWFLLVHHFYKIIRGLCCHKILSGFYFVFNGKYLKQNLEKMDINK